MQSESRIVLPYEPQYSGHREAEKRRKQTHDWLAQRERELAELHQAPSIVPDRSEHEEI